MHIYCTVVTNNVQSDVMDASRLTISASNAKLPYLSLVDPYHAFISEIGALSSYFYIYILKMSNNNTTI